MIFPLSGGQTGATLTVNSSGTGTITVSNTTLGKSYSKSVTAGSSVVFKGLKTGTWTVTLTDGTQTSIKTVVITSDYSANIAYFSASINITYPATSTCIVTDSSGQTVASDTNTGTSTKTWTATVNATGTYTVTATATDGSGKSKSQSVSIASDGQSVSVSLVYEYVIFYNGDVMWNAYTRSSDNLSYKITETELYAKRNGVSGTYVSVTFYTSEFFPLSNYSTLKVRFTAISNRGPYIGVGKKDEAASQQFDAATAAGGWYATIQGSTTPGVVSLDISSLQSESLQVFIGTGKTTSSTGSSFTVDRVWLE